MSVFGAGPEWARKLWPAAAFQFAFVAAVVLFKSAANAIVLARFEAGALPILYLASAALTAGLSALSTHPRARRVSAPASLAFLGSALALLAALGLALRAHAVGWLLYLFADSFATYAAIALWKVLADSYDARAARRVFTLVNGVGMLGGVAGGLLAQELAEQLGIELLLVMGAAILVAGGVAFRFHPPASAPSHASPPAPAAEVLRYVRESGYGQTLITLVLALAVLSAFTDYLFRIRSARSLGETQLAALFGNLQLWIGLFCMVFQLLLATRLLERLGLLRYLALVPTVLAPLAGAALVEPALWPAYLLKLAEASASLSILPVGMQLLYAPVPDPVRDGVRSAIDGPLRKGGLAIAGLVLIGVGGPAAEPALALAVLGLCAVAGLILLRLRPRYVDALRDRVAGVGERPEPTLEGESAELLVEALRSPQPERVLRVVSLMQQASVDLRPHLPAMLAHAHERVVERGVQLAVELNAEGCVPALEGLIQSSLRRPRDEAVWALARLAPRRAAEAFPKLLEAPDVGLRCAAIGALLSIDAGYPAELGLQSLAARGALAPVAERREVARLLGRLRDSRWAELLTRYLEDADGSVRRIAIAAVGEGGYTALAPKLLPFLTWREERRAAREALARLGEPVVALVAEALDDRQRPLSLRYQLPRVLRQLGGQRAFEALLFSNIQDDAFLHYRVGVALTRLFEEHPELTVDRSWVREAIGRRRALYQRLAGPFRDLTAGLGAGSLLTRAVGDRLDQAYELSFWLLGLLYDARALRRIHEHLVGGDPRRRAYALELLENMVAAEDRELIAEQTEAHHRELPPGASGRNAEHLGALCEGDDWVLRACARHVARGMGLWPAEYREDDMNEAIVRRMFALEGIEIFAQSDVDDIAAVAAVARERSFRKGEQIYAEGDPGDALYVITRGSVEVRRHGAQVLMLKEKDAFGTVSLLDGSPRPTDVFAAEELEVLVIDRRDFLDLVADRPELLKGVFRAVSTHLKKVLEFPGGRVG